MTDMSNRIRSDVTRLAPWWESKMAGNGLPRIPCSTFLSFFIASSHLQTELKSTSDTIRSLISQDDIRHIARRPQNIYAQGRILRNVRSVDRNRNRVSLNPHTQLARSIRAGALLRLSSAEGIISTSSRYPKEIQSQQIPEYYRHHGTKEGYQAGGGHGSGELP
jgi:hypothetical protein